MALPILRGTKINNKWKAHPIGEFPDELLHNIARGLTYWVACGSEDISGDDWGQIFAESVLGEHLKSPLGLRDVIREQAAWSAKTIKHGNGNVKPGQVVRFISGRNNVAYSFPQAERNYALAPQNTGDRVLDIWNTRVQEAKENEEKDGTSRYFTDLRTIALLRPKIICPENFNSEQKMTFTLFERETVKFIPAEYVWTFNDNSNLCGFDRLAGGKRGEHCFTWQPNGSQFTIHGEVPVSATTISVSFPPRLDMQTVLNNIGYSNEWVIINRYG